VTDEELMCQIQGGEVSALGGIFDRYQARLVAFLARFTGDAALAEDLAQTTLWRVWENRGQYDPQRPFHTWLFVVAKNVALNHLKGNARRPVVSLSAIPEEDWATPPPGEAFQVRDEVRRALGNLPADQRLCLILREYEGLSYRETAAILECSEGAARILSFRARQALRKMLRSLIESEDCCVSS